MSDRTIHAMTGDGGQIVRYDRSGKWYYEDEHLRRRVTIDEAIQFIDDDATVFFGQPGGKVFDRRVQTKRETTP